MFFTNYKLSLLFPIYNTDIKNVFQIPLNVSTPLMSSASNVATPPMSPNSRRVIKPEKGFDVAKEEKWPYHKPFSLVESSESEEEKK
jgi:hypothetical protein